MKLGAIFNGGQIKAMLNRREAAARAATKRAARAEWEAGKRAAILRARSSGGLVRYSGMGGIGA